MDQPIILAEGTIVVPPGTKPERIDIFLAEHTNMSRSQLQKHIKSGQVTIDGRTVTPHSQVHPGSVIAFAELNLEYREAPPNDDLLPTIIDEDDMYLIVNKPSGLIVHGGPSIHETTLADWAVAHDAKIASVGDQPKFRPGIVHRLDRDVSGVMVIAKTQDAFMDLKRQFQAHTIKKEYLALAYGRIVAASGRINFAIARAPNKSGLMVARPQSNEGRQAETLFEVERFVRGNTLVKVRTLTGRGHQIRVHFKAIGHPLVGDPLYKVRKLKIPKIPVPRLFLHARMLGFMDLKDQARRYTAPLPADLTQYLTRFS